MVHGFNRFVPNMFMYLFFHGDYEEEPYNETFKNRGFNNRTMILLVGSEITMLCLILLLTVFLVVLKKYIKYLCFLFILGP